MHTFVSLSDLVILGSTLSCHFRAVDTAAAVSHIPPRVQSFHHRRCHCRQNRQFLDEASLLRKITKLSLNSKDCTDFKYWIFIFSRHLWKDADKLAQLTRDNGTDVETREASDVEMDQMWDWCGDWGATDEKRTRYRTDLGIGELQMWRGPDVERTRCGEDQMWDWCT